MLDCCAQEEEEADASLPGAPPPSRVRRDFFQLWVGR